MLVGSRYMAHASSPHGLCPCGTQSPRAMTVIRAESSVMRFHSTMLLSESLRFSSNDAHVFFPKLQEKIRASMSMVRYHPWKKNRTIVCRLRDFAAQYVSPSYPVASSCPVLACPVLVYSQVNQATCLMTRENLLKDNVGDFGLVLV